MKNGNLTRSIDSLLLGVGTALTLGIMVSMEFRHNVGVVMDAILGWLPEILPFHIVLFALAAITGLYASLIQKYTMDWDYLKRQQETMRSFQKEFRAAQLAGDKARQQQLQVQQREMLGDQSKMMKMQLKPMAYIGIVSIPLFMWAYLYIEEHAILLSFPFWGVHTISDTVMGPIFYWFYWYFICSIPISQIIRKALDIGGMG
ncbi:MAG: EMC3/TMCO1 family protein [Methanothrix sp.]|jgi:uncharacterized membrane protein (DUF106 family)|nr:EMC3/TMCO1 family protein [Methanothrix sp.]OPX82594.1 MAG: hypothetical protein A4E50_00196 [Methanosaeta sp. PtaB.Bin087]OPY53168.1 MAG: hypothetical protein A4E51_01193 [Methanosaeta sp. PtaU1.Bin055]NLX39869.1 DUF106 domain-containing protein [Methanothrix sp.]HOI68898.1 EMC3/TMCO1 family protein [Methanothrix sp.]